LFSPYVFSTPVFPAHREKASLAYQKRSDYAVGTNITIQIQTPGIEILYRIHARPERAVSIQFPWRGSAI
jgi:hypothetical protein